MPRIKLTERVLPKLTAPTASGKQVIYWEADRPRGFGVLLSGTTSSRHYIAQRDLAGKTRRVTIAAVGDLPLAEAREQATDILLAMRKGVDPRRRSTTGSLQQVLDNYLTVRRLRPSTAEAYRYGVERYLKPWLDRPLRELTQSDVEKRHHALGEDYGPAAANGTMRVLRALWNFAAERDAELPANPVRLTRQWYAEPRRERIVPADKLPAFYKAVRALPNPIAADFLTLLLFTGLRRGEASTLRWENIDLVEKLIRLPAASTKGGKALDLPMVDVVFRLLKERSKLGNAGWVFPSGSAHLSEPKFPLRQVANASGVVISAHDLRRTYISIAATTPGVSPFALKALVNHSLGGGDVTSGYIQLTTAELREPAQKIADRLKALCKISSRSRH